MYKPVFLVICVLLLVIIVGCTSAPEPESPTPTIFIKQGEQPAQPKLKISFSGVKDDTLVTYRLHTLSGQQVQWGTRMSNGSIETVINNRNGSDYVIMAEAEGYISDPLSYTVHVDGVDIFLVEDEQSISEKVAKLEFHFTIVSIP